MARHHDYCTAVTVAFLRLTFSDPLLCLTVSATLREKPIPTTPKHPLARFFASVGGSKDILSEESPQEPADKSQWEISLLDGLEEANLLNGLLAGLEFAKLGSSQFSLSTLRLGTVSRQKLFSLPPALLATPKVPTPSPMTAVRKAHPTLRKSVRKTLLVAFGFRVQCEPFLSHTFSYQRLKALLPTWKKRKTANGGKQAAKSEWLSFVWKSRIQDECLSSRES